MKRMTAQNHCVSRDLPQMHYNLRHHSVHRQPERLGLLRSVEDVGRNCATYRIQQQLGSIFLGWNGVLSSTPTVSLGCQLFFQLLSEQIYGPCCSDVPLALNQDFLHKERGAILVKDTQHHQGLFHSLNLVILVPWIVIKRWVPENSRIINWPRPFCHNVHDHRIAVSADLLIQRMVIFSVDIHLFMYVRF